MEPSMTDKALRCAVSGDFDAIADIWHASASLPGVGPPNMPSVADLRRRIDDEIAAGWKVTVAVQNGTVCGFAAIMPADAVLDQLFMKPGFIGSGFGWALFENCIERMPAGFTLHTASSNENGRRFYEKAGMQILRHDSHPRTGHPVTYYVWRPHRAEPAVALRG